MGWQLTSLDDRFSNTPAAGSLVLCSKAKAAGMQLDFTFERAAAGRAVTRQRDGEARG